MRKLDNCPQVRGSCCGSSRPTALPACYGSGNVRGGLLLAPPPGSSPSSWMVWGPVAVAAAPTTAVAVLTVCFVLLCSWWAQWRRDMCRTAGWPSYSSRLRRVWINGRRCRWTAAGAESEPSGPIQPSCSNHHICVHVETWTQCQVPPIPHSAQQNSFILISNYIALNLVFLFFHDRRRLSKAMLSFVALLVGFFPSVGLFLLAS